MSETTPAGRRTSVKVRIPPARLASGSIYSAAARRLDADEILSWNAGSAALLRAYGLRIASVTVQPVAPSGGADRPRPPANFLLQTEHRNRLLLTCALGALSVSLSGRGDLLAAAPSDRDRLKLAIKENNDRNSTAAMTEALHSLCDASPQTSLRVAIGEGARKKPGERGGNPTLYEGQTIGSGPRRYALAVDTVEGTTKSTLFDHSCGTLLFVTEAAIRPVPDVYFDKCQLLGVEGVGVADPLERVVEAVMEARGTREVNFFALERGRHPIDRMLRLGANMRIDTDGDAYPVIAAGLQWGVFEDNLRPLDGVAGNIGGAAEMIASAAGARYLGVRSSARFCTQGVKTWEGRYDLKKDEEEVIRSRGFDPAAVYRIEDLVPGIADADGAFVASAISDNWHIPGLDAVLVGGNFACVNALFVGSAGTADLYRIAFSYEQPLEATRAMVTPVLTRILGMPPAEIPKAVRDAVADPARAGRLRHEIATSFYTHLAGPPSGAPEPAGERGLRLDIDQAARSESAEALAALRAVMDAAPDWFA
ncbi:MAG TPA: fructose-bisphosphatase class II [Candidatus Polarisedimenticolia bacterium]|nr:fructose-bisphosphatase class II [Candidatus Polarisedimenticolia bacterium]